MPSEGRPQPIDTAVIAAPSDTPASDLWSLVERHEQHRKRVGLADTLAALALGTVIADRLADERPLLVRDALRLGSSWTKIAAALGSDLQTVRSTFATWTDSLGSDEQAEARRLAEAGGSSR
ncbi:hypothetical protein [Streptomyces sp. NBC_00690]|uniref:hypothetical protein n=1 Tax=Streptomyces sp. NBC_00690 TaxID=2975808 RepID=UPI002E27D132|nr:hypothetical protein [Streptomyces sp. NBC_00690]